MGSFTLGDRGQSNVLGIALLVGIVLLVAGSLAVVGAMAVDQRSSSASLASAEATMTELDAEMAAVADGSGASRSVTLPETSQGDVSVQPSAGEVTMTVRNDGTVESQETVTMGTILYEQGDTKIAYQGGGVWKKTANGDESMRVSPPTFDYRYRSGDPTLTFSPVRVDDSSSVSSGSATAEAVGDSKSLVDASQIPLEQGDELTVEVESEYYTAWAELFRDRTSGVVEVEEGNQVARVTLYAPYVFGTELATGALVSPWAGTSTSNNGLVDSYEMDGSGGRNDGRDNTRVIVRGDYQLSNDATINGRLLVGGDFDSTNDARVGGETIINGEADFQGSGGPVVFEETVSVGGDVVRVSDSHEFQEDLIVGESLGSGSQGLYGTVDGTLHVGEDVVVLGGSDVGGDLIVGRDVTYDGGTVDGRVDAGRDLDLNDPYHGDGAVADDELVVDAGFGPGWEVGSASGSYTASSPSDDPSDDWYGGDEGYDGASWDFDHFDWGEDAACAAAIADASAATGPGSDRTPLCSQGTVTVQSGDVAGDIYAEDDVTIRGMDTTVRGNVYANGDVVVEGGATIQGTVVTSGSATVRDDSSVEETVVAGEEVTVTDDATIGYDVYANGDSDGDGYGIVVGNDAEIGDDAVADEDIDPGGPPVSDNVGGEVVPDEDDTPDPDVTVDVSVQSPSSPETMSPPDAKSMNNVIDRKADTLADSEYDGPVEAPDTSSCSPCRLDERAYSFDDLYVDTGETLIFDASDHDVEIYVDGQARIKGEVRVEGEGTVRLYAGAGGGDMAFKVEAGGDVIVDEDGDGTNDYDARQMQVYTRADAKASVGSTGSASTFTGVLIGPGDSASNPGTEINIDDDAVIYGSLIGHVTNFAESAEIHYHEALQSMDRPDAIDGGMVKYVGASSETVRITG